MRQEAGGRRQEAGGRRQRQEAEAAAGNRISFRKYERVERFQTSRIKCSQTNLLQFQDFYVIFPVSIVEFGRPRCEHALFARVNEAEGFVLCSRCSCFAIRACRSLASRTPSDES